LPAALSIGLAAAFITTGWFLTEPLYGTRRTYLAAGAGVLGLLVLGRIVLKGRRFNTRPALRLLAIAVLCGLCLASVDRLLVPLEARSHPFEVFARAAALVLNVQGYPAAAERGALHVDHPEGLLSILPSTEKLGARGLVQLWCLWLLMNVVLDGRRNLEMATTGAATLLLIAFVRFAACTMAYLEYDSILESNGGFDALAFFSGSLIDGLTLIASGLSLDFVRSKLLARAGNLVQSSPGDCSITLTVAVAAAFALLVAFAAVYEPPGRMKSGRVLFDDRFCGVWEPTARMLDTEWYGDFSTYSFNSLAEWLGHWFCVDVNPTRAYSDELLSAYDILVLKTPVLSIAKTEREAIDRFVTKGGGLLLVGDHTNLLGMGTHLNSLCDKYGVRFRYDSVSDSSTGGFVDYYGPACGRSVGALHVNHLQFMTSCSLELSQDAEPIILATNCRRDPHDYSASSFFGRSGPHPELAHGPTVLAASARAGKGRIVAFTDSTVWSSFALFQFDREKLFADLIVMLNHEQSPSRMPLRTVAMVASVVAVIAAAFWIRTGAALPILLGGLVGAWGGVSLADRVHRSFYDLGPPRAPVHEVSFLWQGGNCAFPPVLGDIGSLPLDRAFDTLFVSTQRLGLVPRVAYEYDRDLLTNHTRALFVIAPVDHPPESALSRIESFVRQGGALIVVDDGPGGGSAKDYLNRFGIDLFYSSRTGSNGEPFVHSTVSGLAGLNNVPDERTFVGHRAFGKGHVVYMREAKDYSRIGMGHCFNRPGRTARAKYDTVFWLLRDVLNLKVDDRRYYGVCM
jgi:hypothetical protein